MSGYSAEVIQRYQRAVAALNRGAWGEALSLSRHLVQEAPRHAGVWYVAGVAAVRMQNIDLAVQALGRAVALNPDRVDYAVECARALAMARMMREAISVADRAMALAPAEPLMLDTLGVVYTQANEHAKAATAFRKAVASAPDSADFRFNLATSLTFAGDLAGAESQYEACLQRNPRFWKAHLALSQLRRQSPEDNHIPRLREMRDSGGQSEEARLYVNLALSKELEDIGEDDQAFERLLEGKQAWSKRLDYSIARDEAVFEALVEGFPAPAMVDAGYDSDEPVFVIGMPRSGTTLVDRILSSHPDVHSCGELQNFSVVLKQASGSATPALLDVDTIRRSAALDWRALGEAYVASTRPATGQLPRFVDKLPHNFIYAGHIARSLPRAKIICLRRNAMDTCLGNFRQLFALSSPYYDYSFDLLDTTRYYLLFDRLMRHWAKVMPGRILEVGYEALVADQEGETRRVLMHCGLPWNDACLDFHRNPAPVATASAVQVREPVNRRAIGRWKRYERQLQPVRELLEAAGIDIGD